MRKFPPLAVKTVALCVEQFSKFSVEFTALLTATLAIPMINLTIWILI